MYVRLFKTKKGQTDVTIMWFIIVFLLGLGFVLPFIQQAFSTSSTSYSTTDIRNTGLDDETDYTSISSVNVLSSIGKMFSWNFNTIIPTWLEVCFFLPLRLVLALLLYRQIRSGGG